MASGYINCCFLLYYFLLFRIRKIKKSRLTNLFRQETFNLRHRLGDNRRGQVVCRKKISTITFFTFPGNIFFALFGPYYTASKQHLLHFLFSFFLEIVTKKYRLIIFLPLGMILETSSTRHKMAFSQWSAVFVQFLVQFNYTRSVQPSESTSGLGLTLLEPLSLCFVFPTRSYS